MPGRRPSRRLTDGPALLLLLGGLAAGAPARADDPPPTGEDTHLQLRPLPDIGYDADTGLELGAFVQLARLSPDVHPYVWRLRAQGSVSIQPFAGTVRFTKQYHFLRWDVLRLGGSDVRLLADLEYRAVDNRSYYGLGSGSVAVRPWADLSRTSPAYAATRRYPEYGVARPLLRLTALVPIQGPFEWIARLGVSHPVVTVYAGSKLAEDAASPPEGQTIYGLTPLFRLLGAAGVLVDTRDDEVLPSRGTLTDLVLRASPGDFTHEAYAGLTLTSRVYWSPVPRLLTLAARGLFDVLDGEVPVEDLAEYGGLYPGQGIGGKHGVRGVPAGRFHGKTKVIVNVEARSMFATADLLRQRLGLGMVLFLDGGQVWAGALEGIPGLDTPGLHPAWSTGAGLRVRWGPAFVMRVDVAWSPVFDAVVGGFTLAVYADAEPIL